MQEKRQISHALSSSLYKTGYEAMPLLLKFDHHYSMFHMEKKKKKKTFDSELAEICKNKAFCQLQQLSGQALYSDPARI